MATHGYIKIKGENEICNIHAFHDGYTENILEDIFNIPSYIVNFLKTDKRNSYILDSFTRERGDWRTKNYKSFISSWDSMIPLDISPFKFGSFLIASDPLMYMIDKSQIIKLTEDNIDDYNYDVSIEFNEDRLPSCIITLSDLDIDQVDGFNSFVENSNKYIYLDENKIRIISSSDTEVVYEMNLDHIVVDLLWQEIDPGVKRDKKLETILE